MKSMRRSVASLATCALLLAGLPVSPSLADSSGPDVSGSRISLRDSYRQDPVGSSSTNENRDAGDAPVVQPVASMKGQTCIAAGGVEVPCETDDSWFYAPESCYASTQSMAPYARKRNYTTFECKPVGKDVPSLAPAKPVRIPTSEAEARASAAKKGAQLAEDALADYDFERLTVRTQPSDATVRSDAFVFT